MYCSPMYGVLEPVKISETGHIISQTREGSTWGKAEWNTCFLMEVFKKLYESNTLNLGTRRVLQSRW